MNKYYSNSPDNSLPTRYPKNPLKNNNHRVTTPLQDTTGESSREKKSGRQRREKGPSAPGSDRPHSDASGETISRGRDKKPGLPDTRPSSGHDLRRAPRAD